jgi:hypothetical protein
MHAPGCMDPHEKEQKRERKGKEFKKKKGII